MRVREAIENADRIRPGAYSEDIKRKWVCDMEKRIYNEIFSVYKNEGESFTDLDNITDETELFLPSPYDEIYILYICSMTDFYNGEYQRYNNDTALLTALYSDFCVFYNRNHDHITVSALIG